MNYQFRKKNVRREIILKMCKNKTKNELEENKGSKQKKKKKIKYQDLINMYILRQ